MRLAIFLIVFPLCAFSQLSFQSVPSNFQLYPRNTNDSCIAKIVGVADFRITKVSVLLKSNNELSFYKSINLNTSNFSFDIPFLAGLNNYEISIYSHTSHSDSTLTKTISELLCGDAYMIYGQSNCFGFLDPDTTSFNPEYFEFIRNFYYDDINIANAHWEKGASAIFGKKLGQALKKNSQVPIAILNYAIGGASIDRLGNRNNANPKDLNTRYGEMLFLTDKAGLLENIKAIIWRQGESEAHDGWPPSFNPYGSQLNTLLDNFQNDFPNLKKIYVTQNNILVSSNYDNQGGSVVREGQRQSKNSNAITRVLSTVGIEDGYDGLHYNYNGHAFFTNQLVDLIKHDIYGFPLEPNFEFPDIQKLYYANSSKDSVVMEFQENQILDFDLNKNGKNLSSFIKLSSGPGINDIRFNKNKLSIKLNGTSNATRITYLPSNYPSIYNGPLIKNAANRAALSFHEKEIGNYLQPVSNGTISLINGSLKLSFVLPSVQHSQLKIHKYLNESFVKTILLGINSTELVDPEIVTSANNVYRYEVSIINPTSSSSPYILTKNICPSVFNGTEDIDTCQDCQNYFDTQISLSKPFPENNYLFSSQSIELKPGFTTEPNAIFQAKIYNCN